MRLGVLRSSAFGGMLLALSLAGFSGGDAIRDEHRTLLLAEVIPARAPIEDRVTPPHIPVPPEVRGIYWTARTAGLARADELITYMDETGLNAVVIDVKLDDGALVFVPHDPDLLPYVARTVAIKDLDGLLARLYEHGIYRIARLPVMRDAKFADVHPEVALRHLGGGLWHDAIGSVWIDPASPELASYAIRLAKEAYSRGFDEIQFDYVRFPSDGAIGNITYPIYEQSASKSRIMQIFFDTVGTAMDAAGISASFDLFGMTFWSDDDHEIGQRLVDVYAYADFISPMVYPSHFPNGFEGYANPALHPYEMVKRSLDRGALQLMREQGIPEEASRLKFRPWIQDFDIGARYDAAKIEAQIHAARDAGASGFLIWNAWNNYEPANYLLPPP
ncbi:hypothetical protein HY478_00480 [Candidatus Uhrbacteria bacterium]|nr:hypothetical protein [Candidatus Uhrbacteria bacterium]